MPLNLETDPTLDQALQRLDGLDADQTPTKGLDNQGKPETEVPNQAGDTDEPGNIPDPLPSDTPAGAKDKPPIEPKKEVEPKTVDSKASNFAKDAQRRDTSWKALNQQKAEFEKQRTEFTQREASLAQREEKFNRQSAKQVYTPEQYAQAGQAKLNNAAQLETQAEQLEAYAEKLEAGGKLLEAEKASKEAKEKRDDAAAERGLAKQYNKLAEDKRANPDPTAEQTRQKTEQYLQHYTIEAAKHWPDIAKQGSELQKKVAENIQAAIQQGLDEREYPILRFYSARLAASELASTRVPGLEKALGEAQAKVKELELLTNPGGGGASAARLPESRGNSHEEDAESLRQEAVRLS